MDQPRRTLLLEIAYDGVSFSGWQAQAQQPGVRTIQGMIEDAIEKITGQRENLLGCGRTDAGVSAICQTASFRSSTSIPADKLTLALNALLPPEIRIWRTTDVPSDFHPIADILRKRYRYLFSDARPFFPFLKDRVWFLRKKLNLEKMRQAASYLLGTHDFASFETTGSPRKSTVRTIYELTIEEMPLPAIWERPASLAASWKEESPKTESSQDGKHSPRFPLYALEIEANGFLYNMVRAIVGTLALFGEGHSGFENPASMKSILEAKNRAAAGPTAPPFGLYMVGVTYPPEKLRLPPVSSAEPSGLDENPET